MTLAVSIKSKVELQDFALFCSKVAKEGKGYEEMNHGGGVRRDESWGRGDEG